MHQANHSPSPLDYPCFVSKAKYNTGWSISLRSGLPPHVYVLRGPLSLTPLEVQHCCETVCCLLPRVLQDLLFKHPSTTAQTLGFSTCFYVYPPSWLPLLTDFLTRINSNRNPTIIFTRPQPPEWTSLSYYTVSKYGERILCKALLCRKKVSLSLGL